MKIFGAAILFLVILFLFFVFVSFNGESVGFLIQGIQDPELHKKVKDVYAGIGILLFLQPVSALALLFYFVVNPGKNAVKVVCCYAGFNILLCVLIFLGCATLPWSIPIAS